MSARGSRLCSQPFSTPAYAAPLSGTERRAFPPERHGISGLRKPLLEPIYRVREDLDSFYTGEAAIMQECTMTISPSEEPRVGEENYCVGERYPLLGQTALHLVQRQLVRR